MKKITALLMLCFALALQPVAAQITELYSLEKRIAQGDRSALRELAPSLDDRRACSENVGAGGVFKTTIRAVAQRILIENTRFFNVELTIDSSLTTHDFTTFITENETTLQFDKRATVWLITPLEKRSVDYTIRKVTTAALDKIAARRLTTKTWVVQAGIDKLIDAHSTEALWQIAAHLMQTRSRFNRPDFTTNEHIDLLRLLTGIEVGVKSDINGKKDVIAFDIDTDYSAKAQLNLLIYYLTHHQDFVWDKTTGYFKNTKETIEVSDKTADLYEKIKSPDQTIAVGAFVAFAEMPDEMVDKFFKTHKTTYSNEWNTVLPHEDFGIRFLQQLTLFTAYCRDNKFDYKGSLEFHKGWAKLRNTKDFKARYAVENELIKSFSSKEIAALEFWGIVYENDYQNTFSVGRIIDKWYSKHWQETVNDEKQLAFYLKKAALFKELGMVGNCNNYLRKFANASPEVLQKVDAVAQKSSDNDIKQQASLVAAMPPVLYAPANPKTCDDCTDYTFEELDNAIDKTFMRIDNADKNLIYNDLYDILKYDATDAFLGGGGNKRTEGVDNAIKLLENKFHTTLGFEQKRYKTNYWYYDCIERAVEWQQYLEEKKLVDLDKNEPESLSIH